MGAVRVRVPWRSASGWGSVQRTDLMGPAPAVGSVVENDRITHPGPAVLLSVDYNLAQWGDLCEAKVLESDGVIRTFRCFPDELILVADSVQDLA